MNEPIEERQALWERFLHRWPLEALENMSLVQYSHSGDQDCFVYWLEILTESLGSIWGGSAFKFGVYSRRDQTEKVSDSERSYSTNYAWYSQYGATAEEAFAQVLGQIVLIAKAARAGDLEAVEESRLGPALKWKLAFLYQRPEQPCVLPIYGLRFLRAATNQPSALFAPALQRQLLAGRGDQNMFAYADTCWAIAKSWLQQQAVGEQALAYFNEQPERFVPINTTKKVAGYRLINGRQLALIREGKKLTLFVAPGAWLNSMVEPPLSRDDYLPDRSRNSNLSSCAPELANGRKAVCITLSGVDALEALCSAYEGTELDDGGHPVTCKGPTVMPSVPLNQILFGPPGTGKTFATIEAALEVLDAAFLQSWKADRALLKARFDQLVKDGRIRFVTFHQSFSYEDFVEGLRAESDESSGQLRYEVVDGVFKSLCEVAAAKVIQQTEAPLELGSRRIWKMSLGNTLGSDASIYEECLQGGYVLLGYGGAINFGGCKSRSDVQKRFVDEGVPLEGAMDYSLTSVTAFVTKMKPGDLVVVSDGNFKFRAIGEITGDYSFKAHPEYEADYSQMRPVKWLRQYTPSLPHTELLNNQFSQMTLYELRSPTLNREKLQALLGARSVASVETAAGFSTGQVFSRDYQVIYASADLLELKKPNGNLLGLSLRLLNTLASAVRSGQITLQDIRDKKAIEKLPGSSLEPNMVNGYSNILAPLVEHMLSQAVPVADSGPGSDARVLIIDEINRGNVSRIFGELITLIEPSKRAGADEALSVVLPYSKQRFSVPNNVYLIGTMNTADRSLAGLDIALRRRFTFREMPPRLDLLDKVEVEGVPIGELLRVMNQRIEVLLDRDHCLGHAYFMPLLAEPSFERLKFIFRNQILPLLQEYFFEDWERIGWVLNDHHAKANGTDPFIQRPHTEQGLATLFGSEVAGKLNDQRWELNNDAFGSLSSFRNILG
ncbi:AAA family ATPase [Pseudomonas kurunegalensis]|uniref:AAA family ATPase n=1 Tax=Pseudomonas kurunegalensis TaxID=485880 RepID=UPI0035581F10